MKYVPRFFEFILPFAFPCLACISPRVEAVSYIITGLVAYLLGSIPTGYLAAKSRGIDIRRVRNGAFEQSIETIVISGKVAVNFSWHRKHLSACC